MDVGLAFIFQNYKDELTDAEVWARDLEVALLAEPLGYDFVGAVEHHFYGYAMLPDNFSFLAWVAAKTKRIKVMTAAVILPWNDPLRVTERLIQLDHLAPDRIAFGMGRGLARREYEPFGIDMNEARDRFDEAAKMIVRSLETGIVEGDGLYYPKKPIELRPRPRATFKGRTYCVAMSADSIPVAAELGAVMMAFAQKPWDMMVDQVNTYRSLYEGFHGVAAPAPSFCNFMFCDESADRAEEMAHKYMGRYFDVIMDHYEMTGDHWKKTKGYGDYAAGAEAMAHVAFEEAKKAYVGVNDWGTPQKILEEYDRRRQLLGEFDLFLNPTYGGMSLEDVRGSLNLYSQKVLPELKSWKKAA